MGILDGIVEWIAEQVMNILDLITTSVLGALGCSMDGVSSLLSCCRDHVSGLSGTGHRADPLKLGMAAL